MVQRLEYVKKRKLDAIPDARLSGAFWANQSAMLENVQAVMTQDGQADDFGLFDLMNERGQSAALATVTASFEKVRGDATAMNQAATSTSMGALEQNFRNEVPDALGVDLGLHFSDGD
ncbi:MAG: hypothetical protein JNK82_39125 [Myxococcaceae bacterium]|nr:hypothetical protein [Myxococcaceae bacterium]